MSPLRKLYTKITDALLLSFSERIALESRFPDPLGLPADQAWDGEKLCRFFARPGNEQYVNDCLATYEKDMHFLLKVLDEMDLMEG